jgi:Flp pilus assembly protein TadB
MLGVGGAHHAAALRAAGVPVVSRPLVVCGLLAWAGVTLLLSCLRWSHRPTLADRLRPYSPGAPAGARRRRDLFSVASVRDVVGPLSRALGERVAACFGVSEQLALRLERLHEPVDVTTFRVRQVGWATAAFTAGALVSLATGAPAAVAVLLTLGSPLLAFLVVEQRLALRSEAWQRRLTLELPVVAEQVGMLLSSGWSLNGALARVASRGAGAAAHDLRRVLSRIQQGVGEREALREWAAVAQVDAVTRLVDVLVLERETADLGRLIGDEARAIRRDAHRRLVEQIEQRSQVVWIPVTVAALVPGVIFIAVPFLEVLRLLGGT